MSNIRTTDNSQRLFSECLAVFPGGVNSPVRAFRGVGGEPFIVDHGVGPFLVDVDGNRYVDYIMSWGPLVLGHAAEVIVEAISAQAKRGTSFGAPSALELELAQLIRSLMPSLEMIRFVSSGTEAGMSVIRLARGATGRSKILKFSGCYHGHCDSLLVRSGSGVATLSLPDSPGVPATTAAATLVAQFNDLESVKRSILGSEQDLAAIILEPVVGNAGLIPPEPGFLAALRAICDSTGALLIFDEVMTGFRVALEGAQALYGVTPDLTMLGKVIGGGLPVGAFGGRREIMQHIAPQGSVYQAGTLSGNPLAMAAGKAALTEWAKEHNFRAAANAASAICEQLRSSAKRYNLPLVATNVGSMFGFFFHSTPVKSFEDATNCSRSRYSRFFHLALEQGVYFPPSPYEACFTSAAHNQAALSHTFSVIEEAMRQLAEEKCPA